MKKVLIVHSMHDPIAKVDIAQQLRGRFRRVLSQQGIKDLVVDSLVEDLYETGRKVPRGYNAYLIHPKDVDHEDLRILRGEQPSSRLYALNRMVDYSSEEEQELYTHFTWGFEEEDIQKIIDAIMGM